MATKKAGRRGPSKPLPKVTQPKRAGKLGAHLEFTTSGKTGPRRGRRGKGSPEGGGRTPIAAQVPELMRAGGYAPMLPDPATLYGYPGRTVRPIPKNRRNKAGAKVGGTSPMTPPYAPATNDD